MRLDPDLVRSLLLEIEALEPQTPLYRKWTKPELECLWLMKEEGFIDAHMPVDDTGYAYSAEISRLNFSGHELIKNIRDDELYETMKAKLSTRLKDWSIATLAHFAAEYTKNLASS